MDVKYGLLGEKLSHSYSKTIHAMFGNNEYEHISVDKDELRRLLLSREFRALNVTIPYKKEVIPYCDALSPTARAVGCVNTLVFDNGSLVGHNTDYAGFLYMAKSAGICFGGKKVLIFGSGGTSLTACAVASDEGASQVTVVSRSGDISYADLSAFYDYDVLVNTTPVGMFPKNGESLVKLSNFTRLSGVIDAIYNPLRTELIFDAQELGIPCANGLTMLVSQAKYAHELFFGTKLADSVTLDVLTALEKNMQNLVLVGMPGCGKTVLGKLLANMLGREFIDTDALIEKKAGRSIPEIFSSDGEEAFRDMESEVIRETGKCSGAVIATGGGAVKRPENYRPLKQNGLIFFIERELALLDIGGRPLSGTGMLSEMYAERLPLYERFSDIRIGNNASLEDAAEIIIPYFKRGVTRHENSRY